MQCKYTEPSPQEDCKPAGLSSNWQGFELLPFQWDTQIEDFNSLADKPLHLNWVYSMTSLDVQGHTRAQAHVHSPPVEAGTLSPRPGIVLVSPIIAVVIVLAACCFFPLYLVVELVTTAWGMGTTKLTATFTVSYHRHLFHGEPYLLHPTGCKQLYRQGTFTLGPI